MCGAARTNELLQVAAAHKVLSEVEVMPFDQVNEAMEKLKAKANTEFRIVLKW